MWTKCLLVAAAVLLLAQNITARSKDEHNCEKSVREYIEIDNATYYIDTSPGHHREEAKAMCESRNLTMVTFESQEKWSAINEWLADSFYPDDRFWIGAIRDPGRVTWVWQDTGDEIVDFYWAPGQPTMNEILVMSCIYFSYTGGGWEDVDCSVFLLDVMCQK